MCQVHRPVRLERRACLRTLHGAILMPHEGMDSLAHNLRVEARAIIPRNHGGNHQIEGGVLMMS
eukprot:SAG31_NODE_5314_length_2613_cov_4.902148_2_plen_64_part_00